MRNPKLVPYETIIRATSGESEAETIKTFEAKENTERYKSQIPKEKS